MPEQQLLAEGDVVGPEPAFLACPGRSVVLVGLVAAAESLGELRKGSWGGDVASHLPAPFNCCRLRLTHF